MVLYDLPPSPYLKANCFSRIFFWWLNGFFGQGCKRPLRIKDLYDTIPEDKSSNLGKQLADQWAKQYSLYLTELRFEKEGDELPDGVKKILRPSLTRAIITVFRSSYMYYGILAILEECIVRIAQPLSLGFMIRYYSQPGKFPDYVRYLSALGIVLAGLLYMFTHHCFFFGVSHMGMQIRVACSALLYRKSLNLSQPSLQKTAIGQVVNLVANDVNRFDWVAIYLHYLWIGPIQAMMVTAILWYYIGYCCFIGFVILFLFVPLQIFVGRRFSILRQATAIRTDKRIRILSEIISGIRVIKMYTWEKPFSAFVGTEREDEVKYIRKTSNLRALNMTIYLTSSKVIVFVTLLVYVLTGNGLTAELVFVTLALYNNVRLVMTLFFPTALALLAETKVSIKRLEEFLLLDERVVPPDKHLVRKTIGVSLKDVTAKWSEDSTVNTLNNVTLSVKAGKLISLCGHVGAGKGSILSTILHELPILSGTVEVHGTLAYVSQEAILFMQTVKENILFGKPFQSDWYDEVIEACALEHDLDLLPFGDNTLVSDRGQTLSGGQKARITLARAVYANADIYLMDDPLSAVDASVGEHLFSKCINGILKDKARILVTHQLQFLKNVDYVIIMEDGKIYAEGTYAQLLEGGFDFEQLAKVNITRPKQSPSSMTNTTARGPIVMDYDHDIRDLHATPSMASLVTSKASKVSSKKYATEDLVNVVKQLGSRDTSDISPVMPMAAGEGPPAQPVVHKRANKGFQWEIPENERMGGVGYCLYLKYFRAGSNCCTLLFLLFITLVCQVFFTGSDYWLSVWTEAADLERKNVTKFKNRKHPMHYLYNNGNVQKYGYVVMIVVLIIISWSRTVLFFHICMRSSIHLHRRMFQGIIRAPMKFFEDNSAGRILNRFSKDMGQIDDNLPPTAFDAISVFMNVFGIMVIIGVVNPILLVPAFLLCVIFFLLRRVYVRTSRSVKRLEGITKSPVFAHFGTSLYGIATIRAYEAQEEFIRQFDTHQDLHTSTWYLFLATTRWFGVWLDWISLLFVTVVTFSFVFSSSSGSQVGLAVSSAMMLSGYFQWGVRQAAELENQMVSTERIIEYADLQPEAALESDKGESPPADWPTKGEIEFQNVSLKYGDHTVLSNVTFTALGSEKIGIVGRTGAGKSTLISVLFRLAEPTGTILVDKVNVTQIGLHDLRQIVSIIPQEPVLFGGSLRKNLDPFDRFTDAEIWDALDWCHLSKEGRQFPIGLDFQVSEGGANFSVGQRQLLCLGRAILKNNKILVLDEATASVDVETDSLIQKTIHNRFAASTVLTIAHRLHTVMDCDKIIVLDAGKIKEFDEPFKLLSDSTSALRNLVDQTGKESADDLMKQAKNAHDKREALKLKVN